jgi:hypothetical protein
MSVWPVYVIYIVPTGNVEILLHVMFSKFLIAACCLERTLRRRKVFYAHKFQPLSVILNIISLGYGK